MNSNFSISRFDIDDHNGIEGWMEKISARVREDELKSPQDRVNEAFQAGEIDSLMHGAFYSAISVLPIGAFVHDYRNGYVDRLAEIKDNEIGNWIAELIQNARDIHATEIEIFISDDELRFIHNGRKFKTAEIVALMNINRTTKKGDLATIGRNIPLVSLKVLNQRNQFINMKNLVIMLMKIEPNLDLVSRKMKKSGMISITLMKTL